MTIMILPSFDYDSPLMTFVQIDSFLKAVTGTSFLKSHYILVF